MKGAALLFFILGLTVKGQDIHFSQFNSSPLNINPALTGLFEGHERIALNHRNQWKSITNPFVTYSGSFDLNIKPNVREDYFGIGVLMNTDKAGEANLQTLQAMLSLSYTKNISPSFFLSYGMQGGVTQRSLNTSKLTTESQYNGDRFDPTMSNGENITENSIMSFDISAGLNGFIKLPESQNLNLGYSLYHFNKPEIGFLGADVRLPAKSIIHINGLFNLKKRFSLLPGFIYQHQGRNSQALLGSSVKYKLDKSQQSCKALYLGTWLRIKEMDALIFSARFDFNNLNFGLSYDINISTLSEASNNKGAVELSLIYIIERSKANSRYKRIPCPMFL
jgi:type IX secretion system PorP/SprF family membrane protein